MEWLQSNWIWIVLGIGFIAFHMFGHGGHRHGKSGGGEHDHARANDATTAPDKTGSAASPTLADEKRHKHGS